MSETFLKVYTDGSCLYKKNRECSIGFVIKNTWSDIIFEHSEKIGKGTNNVAEFTALSRALDKLLYMDIEEDEIEFFSDSQLLVNGINKKFNFDKTLPLKLLMEQIRSKLMKINKPYTVSYIPREENKEADSLTKKN